MKKRLLALLLAALTALSLTACGAEEQPVTSQIFAMDTVMDFAVYGENAQAALTAASQEINALEQRLSRTRAGSEISTLNDRLGGALGRDGAAAAKRAGTER